MQAVSEHHQSVEGIAADTVVLGYEHQPRTILWLVEDGFDFFETPAFRFSWLTECLRRTKKP